MRRASDAIFLITETRKAIQTEATLQPHCTCCLRVMGKKSRIAEIVILSLSQRSLRRFNPSCDNCLSARWRHWLLLLIHAIARGFLYVRCGLVLPCGLIVSFLLDVAISKFRQRQCFLIEFIHVVLLLFNKGIFLNILVNHYRVCE